MVPKKLVLASNEVPDSILQRYFSIGMFVVANDARIAIDTSVLEALAIRNPVVTSDVYVSFYYLEPKPDLELPFVVCDDIVTDIFWEYFLSFISSPISYRIREVFTPSETIILSLFKIFDYYGDLDTKLVFTKFIGNLYFVSVSFSSEDEQDE